MVGKSIEQIICLNHIHRHHPHAAINRICEFRKRNDDTKICTKSAFNRIIMQMSTENKWMTEDHVFWCLQLFSK